MSEPTPEAVGLAALAVCESLMIALMEEGVLDKDEAQGVLEDAMCAHDNAAQSKGRTEVHRAAARLIEHINDGIFSARQGAHGL